MYSPLLCNGFAPLVESKVVCGHWLNRKRRHCKMAVIYGKKYCAEHDVSVNTESDRIPCPLDGRHTVYKSKLDKHMKICNARAKTVGQPEYIQKNINIGDDVDKELEEDLKNIKLKDLNDQEFSEIIQKVKNVYRECVENKIGKVDCHHKCMDGMLQKEELGKEQRKHLMQLAALLGILEKEGQIKNSTIFLEFGAGKGQLAVNLVELLAAKENSKVILVDRMSLRHKKDNKIADRLRVERIKADIADFCIDKFSDIQNFDHCVAVSKHLCGGATDLALRCITQASQKLTDFILIAMCCHHQCDWHSFVGKDFLKKHNISQRDFVIITKMVGWAVCGTGLSRERRKALQKNVVEPNEITENQRLPLPEREAIGFMCKRILDYARLVYLDQHNYDANLHYYVSKEVTLENVALLAKRRQVVFITKLIIMM